MEELKGNLIILFVVISLSLLIPLPSVEGTLTIIAEATNETSFSVEEAAIGTGSAYGLSGYLVVSTPVDACTTVDAPPTLPLNSSIDSFILLATVKADVKLDLCSMARKAKNAQAAGYAGIVMRRLGSNSTSGVTPPFIGLEWVGVRIYACVVGDDMGHFLMERYAYPNKYYVRFDNEPYYALGLLTNFVIVGLLAFIAILLLLRLFHYLYFSVTTRVIERRRVRKALLSESQLRKLPVLSWSSSIPQDTCSICIDQFEQQDEIRVLPCSHVFHKTCIDPWLLKESRKCPNCKGRVLFPNERGRFVYSSEEDDETEESERDERTPLLRPRENYRFVETLTESHNSRMHHHQEHYLQDEEEENNEPPIPSSSRTGTKVTFAPAVSVMSSGSSSSTPASSLRPATVRTITTNAFVLPMAPKGKLGKSALKSPQRKVKTGNNEGHSSASANHPGPGQSPRLSPCSSSSTLLDYHDIPEPDTVRSVSSTQSFHSCVGFDSEFPSLEAYSGSEGSRSQSSYGSFDTFSSNNPPNSSA